MLLLILRSILFNIVFYLNLIGLMVLGMPVLAFGWQANQRMARQWGKNSLWLLEKICGLRVEFVGVEHIPAGAAIIAPKHQSILETFALTVPVQDFTYIHKRELTYIPFFGWYLARAGQLSIDRKKGGSALAQVAAMARAMLPLGRRIFIFPEGTRRAAGAPPAYKYGVTHLYTETGVPCVPVAINSGLFWPRRSFLRRPGVLTIEFLPSIAPGLDRAAFAALLQETIETATNRLMDEAIARDPSLAVNRLKPDASAAEQKESA